MALVLLAISSFNTVRRTTGLAPRAVLHCLNESLPKCSGGVLKFVVIHGNIVTTHLSNRTRYEAAGFAYAINSAVTKCDGEGRE